MSDAALVPFRQQSTAVDAYTPRSISEAIELAKVYAASRILGSYGTPEQVMLIMATGAELGIPPTAALRGLYVVEGKVFMSSDLMVALCLRSDRCSRFELVEIDDRHAVYEVERKGSPSLRFGFSVEDARRALLGGGAGDKFKPESNWAKYPSTMCRHRAAAIAARAVFPDVIMGLYEDGERDEIVAVPQPTPVQPLTAAVVEAESVAHTSPVEGEPESNVARVVRLLDEAETNHDVIAVRDKAVTLWPTERPSPVKRAFDNAKARISKATRGVAEREPGQEG